METPQSNGIKPKTKKILALSIGVFVIVVIAAGIIAGIFYALKKPAKDCFPKCTNSNVCDKDAVPPRCVEPCNPGCHAGDVCDTTVVPPKCKDPCAKPCASEYQKCKSGIGCYCDDDQDHGVCKANEICLPNNYITWKPEGSSGCYNKCKTGSDCPARAPNCTSVGACLSDGFCFHDDDCKEGKMCKDGKKCS